MPWVRLDEEFARHPKVIAAGPLGMAMQVAALCYCNQYLTDGFVPRSIVSGLLNLQGLGMREWHGELIGGGQDASWELIVEDLLVTGLWQEVEGGYRIHDYLDYQPSREHVQELSEKRKAAGQQGGLAKAKQRSSKVLSKSSSKTEAKLYPGPVPPVGTEGSTEGSPKSYSPSAAPKAPRSKRKKPEEHPDARRLCELLADLVAANANGDRPFRPGQVPQKWLDDARLLLTSDGEGGAGYSVVQVEYLIRWSQADSFEAGVVQSMPKLRERRRVLVGKIKPKANGRRPLPNTADLDARVEATLRDLEGAPPGPGASDEERAAYYARFSQEVPA